jgi:hypothetical protein
MRFRLIRSLRGDPLWIDDGRVKSAQRRRIVWLMLNPSTANAFKDDPTIRECIKRSIYLEFDVMEVVNLFAFRTPHPRVLRWAPGNTRGAGADNDTQIALACDGADMVMAAWGNHGLLADRYMYVRSMLLDRHIRMHHLGLTGLSQPKHPSARGVHRIPADIRPQLYRWV